MRKLSSTIDWKLILLFAVLVSIGWLSVFSTTFYNEFSMNTSYGRQLIWIACAFVCALFFIVLNYRFFPTFATPLYVFFLLLLLAVLLFGKTTKGATSWLGFGGIGIQPTEFAKYATCLLLARYIGDKNCDLSNMKNLLTAFVIILIPVMFILLQNDTGSSLPFFFLVFALFREGLPSWILIVALLAVLFFITLIFIKQWIVILVVSLFFFWIFWKTRKQWRRYVLKILVIYFCLIGYILTVEISYHHLLKDHQRARIESLFGKIDDPKGIDYNVTQSKIAIGSGGWTGKGFMNGTQTSLNFVPEQYTDFIFCTIGEEFGFVGSAGVLLIYLLFIGRIISRSEKQREPFVRAYGYCIASIFFAHLMINIGMTIGLMPVIGIPLPFISYGGSSLLAYTIMLFTFINLDAKTNSWM